jgi:hypothetical protein
MGGFLGEPSAFKLVQTLVDSPFAGGQRRLRGANVLGKA